ncbi:MAG TPA: Holliday junction resolvase RuvX [Candidatus Saccharimonadales bacterium]|nr:Holliday junction resolvase RuvX [Candidatus Saccharimonadales bacterium]
MEAKEIKDYKLLGIDYGDTNIGLAFGASGLASPLKTVSGKNPQTAIHEIAALAINNKVTKLVFGIALTHDGKETPQSIKTRQFAKLLKVYLKLPAVFVDEAHTSMEAQNLMISTGFSKKDRRHGDQYAATLIIKRFYDEQAKGS